jgi:lipopolysaccharide/colanic/teichoic acid biosynthesis glycosyltransferase
VALFIKWTSPGPVLFVQQRAGLGGKPFPIFKFRTMRVGADAEKALLRQHSEQDGPAFKLASDPRVTRVGQLLRTTSVDELPQLLNVLLGNMSLVGPRPLPIEEANECELWHRQRLDATPGMTCIWQVTGRSRVTFSEWVRMDIEYIRGMSLLQDVKLILLTIPSVLFCKGAR